MKVSIFMCNSKVLTWGTVGTLTKHLERCLTFGDFSSRSCVADRGVYRGFFFCYRWSLWSCHGSCDAWIKVCHSYRGDGWGTFVSVLKSHPLTSPHPAAMNVSILFSWIFACTELILSRHIFWLRICEKKIVFFMFDISLFSITTLPKI